MSADISPYQGSHELRSQLSKGILRAFLGSSLEDFSQQIGFQSVFSLTYDGVDYQSEKKYRHRKENHNEATIEELIAEFRPSASRASNLPQQINKIDNDYLYENFKSLKKNLNEFLLASIKAESDKSVRISQLETIDIESLLGHITAFQDNYQAMVAFCHELQTECGIHINMSHIFKLSLLWLKEVAFVSKAVIDVSKDINEFHSKYFLNSTDRSSGFFNTRVQELLTQKIAENAVNIHSTLGDLNGVNSAEYNKSKTYK